METILFHSLNDIFQVFLGYSGQKLREHRSERYFEGMRDTLAYYATQLHDPNRFMAEGKDERRSISIVAERRNKSSQRFCIVGRRSARCLNVNASTFEQRMYFYASFSSSIAAPL